MKMMIILSCLFSIVYGAVLGNGTLENLERGQRTILNRMGHVTVWRFPQGPMTLGCLIMAAGLALGICIMCCWMHWQWREMTQGAASAIQSILQAEHQNVLRSTELYTPLSALPTFDNTSLVVQATVLDAPPAYNEVI